MLKTQNLKLNIFFYLNKIKIKKISPLYLFYFYFFEKNIKNKTVIFKKKKFNKNKWTKHKNSITKKTSRPI